MASMASVPCGVMQLTAVLLAVPAKCVTIWQVGQPQGYIEVREDLPTPREFYKDYLQNEGGPFEGIGKPVLLSGAAKQMPAFQKWTDDYLKETHGSVIMDQVETEKKETRTALPKVDWKLEKFLRKYNESQIYSTSVTPKPLGKEVYMLPFMNCGGGYSKRLSETVIWFSSGSTKSVIHNDGNHNVHCMFAGTKHWILWKSSEPINQKSLGWVNGEEEDQKGDPKFKDAYGTYGGKVDVDNVDVEKFPKWKKLPWWNMTMKAGDCAFIPKRWYHYVEAEAQRSISVHIWFGAAPKFSEKACEEMQKKGYNPDKQFLTSIGDCSFGWNEGKAKSATTCKVRAQREEL